jgi:transposase
MPKPIFVRTITDVEREQLKAGLRSSEAFMLRRCQIFLASERGEHAIAIARSVGCSDQAVREAITAFNTRGLEALKPGSRRPHKTQAAFSDEQAERLKEFLHQSPRSFGKPTSVWTCDLAAEVSFGKGLTQEQVSGETIRATLKRMGVKWARAKHWITSPDPEYSRKKSAEID